HSRPIDPPLGDHIEDRGPLETKSSSDFVFFVSFCARPNCWGLASRECNYSGSSLFVICGSARTKISQPCFQGPQLSGSRTAVFFSLNSATPSRDVNRAAELKALSAVGSRAA